MFAASLVDFLDNHVVNTVSQVGEQIQFTLIDRVKRVFGAVRNEPCRVHVDGVDIIVFVSVDDLVLTRRVQEIIAGWWHGGDMNGVGDIVITGTRDL